VELKASIALVKLGHYTALAYKEIAHRLEASQNPTCSSWSKNE
jgi:hypothetical protein